MAEKCICGIPLAEHGNGCLRPIGPTLPIRIDEIGGYVGRSAVTEVEKRLNELLEDGLARVIDGELHVYDNDGNLILTMPTTGLSDVIVALEFKPCVCGHSKDDHIECVHADGVVVTCQHCACDGYHTEETVGDRRKEVERRTIREPTTAAYNNDGTPAATVDNMVEHPQHYGGADDPYEHIKVCEAKGWGYHIGNCTKYLWRAGKKHENIIEDLEKAKWYLERYIAKLKAETPE